MTGCIFGLIVAKEAALDAETRDRMRPTARVKHARAGAHFVIDTVADIDVVPDDIERALTRGERSLE